MPFKSSKIIIEHTEYDRRIKISEEVRDEIRLMYEDGYSIRSIARKVPASRRSVQFILFPEKLKENLERRKERGGSAIYYCKEKQREYIKSHRRYKQDLKTRGLI